MFSGEWKRRDASSSTEAGTDSAIPRDAEALCSLGRRRATAARALLARQFDLAKSPPLKRHRGDAFRNCKQ